MSSCFKPVKWKRESFFPDLMAGLTVTLVNIPESMSYALDKVRAWIEENKQS